MKLIYIPIFSLFLILIGIVGTIQLAYAGASFVNIVKTCEPSSQMEEGTITWTIIISNPGTGSLSVTATDTRHGTIFTGLVPGKINDIPGTVPPIVFVEPNLPADTYTDTATVIPLKGDPRSSTAVCIVEELPVQVIGGQIIPIEATSLLLAGAQSTTWIIPIVLSMAGIGIFVVSRKSGNS